jgi:hypothetical protein
LGALVAPCLLVLVLPLHARADPPPADGAPPDHSTLPAAPASSEAAGDSVAVVLIGENAESSLLTPLLIELLGRRKVRLTFLHEARFDPAHLLSSGEGDAAAWVFIELEGEHAVRLSFRGPHAERFLFRGLSLRDGLDEVGRELVAQVIESSVEALLRSGAGMSRDQARAALALRVPDAAPSGTAPPVLPRAPRGARVGAWLGLRYEGEWTGSDLGAAHGPGGEIGVEWRGPTLVRARLSVDRWFSETVASPQIRAGVQSWPLRLSVDVGRRVGRAQTLLVALGGGADLRHIDPRSTIDSPVTASSPTLHLVPMVRAALRYETGDQDWRVAVEVFADVSLVDTHYDVQVGDATERIAAPWPVRPGAALVLAWRPALGL